MLARDIVYMHAKFNYSSISLSRDMFGAHQNSNGSCDLTMPFQGQFAIHGLALATINLSTKSDVSISTHYKNMKNQ